jgi:hypothetical protein
VDYRWLDLSPILRLLAVAMAAGVVFDTHHGHLLIRYRRGGYDLSADAIDVLRMHRAEVVSMLQHWQEVR